MLKYFYFSLYLILYSCLTIGQVDNTIQAIVQAGHTKPVICSEFSPDGRFLATGSLDNAVILWDLKYGKQIKSFNYHLKSVITVRFSSDSKSILSASSDNTIKLIDITTGDLKQSLALRKGELYNAYFSFNGQHIIGLDKRNGVSVWSVKSGKLIGEFEKDFAADSESMIISPDGQKILSKENNKKVLCLNINSGDTLFSIPFDKAYSMQFSPDGTFITISSAKLFAQTFDAETGALLKTLTSDSERLCDGCNTAFSISHNNEFIFTMSNKLDGILWNRKTGKSVKKFGTVSRRPYSIDFSKDDEYLLLSFDDQVFVYHIKSGKEKIRIKNKWIDYYEFQFSKANNTIALPGAFNTIEIWDAEKGRKIKTLKGYLNEQQADGLGFDYTNRIDKKILQFISYKNNISVSTDNKHLAIGKVDSVAIIFDILTGRRLKVLKENKKAVFCHDYSSDGKWFATAGGDRIIRIYDTRDYTLKYQLRGHRALIFDIKFSENGKEIVSGSWDATIKVWNFKEENLKQTIDLKDVSPYLVRYSPNDLYILSGDLSQNVQFWEFDSRQNFRSLIGHTNTISGIEFSKDNQTMITSSWDGKIKLWHVLTGMMLMKIDQTNAPVYSAIFSLDGKSIISGGGDRNIRIWDVKTGELKTVLKGHTSAVTALCMTQNGQYLVSRAANGEVKIWDYQAGKEIYTYLQINQEDWLVKSPEGHFDGSKNALSLINYVSGLDVVSIESLFDKYYTPNLVKRLMAGEKLNDTGESLNHLLKSRPELAFNVPGLEVRSGEIHTDSVIKSKVNQVAIDIAVLENGKAVNEIRLYNNGKLIENENSSKNLVFRSADKYQKTFEIDLIDGLNRIKAIAVAENEIESDPIYLNIEFDGESAKVDLFIFSIGINKYKNPAYNLNYAVKDASDFSKSLFDGGGQLFNNVYTYSLKNDEANKSEMKRVFDELKQKIGPEDVFVFYYAGHGVMTVKSSEKESDFYIVTHDIVNLYGNDIEDKGVSATDLLGYSKVVSAQKQLFILDACHSGGALSSFVGVRGDGREKTLAQLARNTGTFFLTASQDIQYANEAGDLKHGLFTYALLEILNGDNNSSAEDGKITINEMKTYVEDRVPELSEKYHGSSQYPTSYSFGQDFPIVIIK